VLVKLLGPNWHFLTSADISLSDFFALLSQQNMKTVSKQETNPSAPTFNKTFFVIGVWVLHYMWLLCERDLEMTEPTAG
jgi:hypothetical protein